MKFLFVVTPRPGASPVPDWLVRAEKAMALLQEWKASGKMLCAYMQTNGGGVGVFEASSVAELWDGIDAYPFKGLDWHIEPVEDAETEFKRMTKKAKAAAKPSP